MRAWIEILELLNFCLPDQVALYMRAWIEIEDPQLTRTGINCRSLYESVD